MTFDEQEMGVSYRAKMHQERTLESLLLFYEKNICGRGEFLLNGSRRASDGGGTSLLFGGGGGKLRKCSEFPCAEDQLPISKKCRRKKNMMGG